MKTKVALEVKILNVLENNRDEDNVFMTPEDITVAIYGNEIFLVNTTKFREMQDDLVRSVRTRMGQVKELAEENGMTVIPRRKPVKDGTKKFRVLGWKVLTEGDEAFVVDELIYKRDNGQSRINSFNRLKETAESRGLIEAKKAKELTEKIEG